MIREVQHNSSMINSSKSAETTVSSKLRSASCSSSGVTSTCPCATGAAGKDNPWATLSYAISCAWGKASLSSAMMGCQVKDPLPNWWIKRTVILHAGGVETRQWIWSVRCSLQSGVMSMKELNSFPSSLISRPPFSMSLTGPSSVRRLISGLSSDFRMDRWKGLRCNCDIRNVALCVHSFRCRRRSDDITLAKNWEQIKPRLTYIKYGSKITSITTRAETRETMVVTASGHMLVELWKDLDKLTVVNRR